MHPSTSSMWGATSRSSEKPRCGLEWTEAMKQLAHWHSTSTSSTPLASWHQFMKLKTTWTPLRAVTWEKCPTKICLNGGITKMSWSNTDQSGMDQTKSHELLQSKSNSKIHNNADTTQIYPALLFRASTIWMSIYLYNLGHLGEVRSVNGWNGWHVITWAVIWKMSLKLACQESQHSPVPPWFLDSHTLPSLQQPAPFFQNRS